MLRHQQVHEQCERALVQHGLHLERAPPPHTRLSTASRSGWGGEATGGAVAPTWLSAHATTWQLAEQSARTSASDPPMIG